MKRPDRYLIGWPEWGTWVYGTDHGGVIPMVLKDALKAKETGGLDEAVIFKLVPYRRKCKRK